MLPFQKNMNKYLNYTYVIPTYNEEQRIRRVLDYYSQYVNILAVDNYSTDNTLEILKEYQINYIQYNNHGSSQTPEWFQNVIPYLNTEYVLFGSASYFYTKEFLRLCDELAFENEVSMVVQNIDTFTCGERTLIFNNIKTRKKRTAEVFFKKNQIITEEIFMHLPYKVKNPENILVLNDVKFDIVHLRDSDTISLAKKCLEYAYVEAKQLIAKDKSFNLCNLIKKIIIELLRLVRFPKEIFNKRSIREIWARIFWLTITYWIVWDLKTCNTLEFSRKKNEELWKKLCKN
jgi:glycosyltransferase involved in cell wall biosynthesis